MIQFQWLACWHRSRDPEDDRKQMTVELESARGQQMCYSDSCRETLALQQDRADHSQENELQRGQKRPKQGRGREGWDEKEQMPLWAARWVPGITQPIPGPACRWLPRHLPVLQKRTSLSLPTDEKNTAGDWVVIWTRFTRDASTEGHAQRQ